MMKKIAVTLLTLLVILPAFAQMRKVSGVVRDENGDIMPGAIVVVKSGAADGPVSASTTTDASGRYSIECQDQDYLSVYFLGYNESVIPVKNQRTIVLCAA